MTGLVVLLLAAGVVGATARTLVRLARRRRADAARTRRSVTALRALAAEIAAGAPPREALRTVSADLAGPLEDSVADPLEDDLAAAAGADDDAAAAQVLRSSGVRQLTALGACWRLSSITGAPLTASVGRLADGTARRATDADEVAAVLAGPRATAVLLALLPVLGLVLASSVGAGPVGYLLGTGPGRACLLTGLVFDAAGLRAIERLARDAEVEPRSRRRPRRRRRGSIRAPDELALVADLLAAALEAGLPLTSAIDAVDRAVPGPRRHPLGPLGRALATGRVEDLADPTSTASLVPPELLRCVRRSGHSGARLAADLRLLADDVRGEAALAALTRARRVGVLAVIPLGLCCLPAFVLLAVVPLAAGLLRGVTG